jgi:ABC-type glycerol-3-phosphate transport system permease component
MLDFLQGLGLDWNPVYLMAVVALVVIVVVYFLFVRKSSEEDTGKSPTGTPPRS